MWKVEDHTSNKNGTNVGYLTLTFDGKRVSDFFPYARGADPNWIFEMAHKLAEYANKSELLERYKIDAEENLRRLSQGGAN